VTKIFETFFYKSLEHNFVVTRVYKFSRNVSFSGSKPIDSKIIFTVWFQYALHFLFFLEENFYG